MVYLQISLNIAAKDRPAAAAIYAQFKGPFLAQAKGAKSKELLIRDEDVQVLHGFDSVALRHSESFCGRRSSAFVHEDANGSALNGGVLYIVAKDKAGE